MEELVKGTGVWQNIQDSVRQAIQYLGKQVLEQDRQYTKLLEVMHEEKRLQQKKWQGEMHTFEMKVKNEMEDMMDSKVHKILNPILLRYEQMVEQKMDEVQEHVDRRMDQMQNQFNKLKSNVAKNSKVMDKIWMEKTHLGLSERVADAEQSVQVVNMVFYKKG